MKRLTHAFAGDGLVARVLRSASWLVLGYGTSQFLRLAANLVLTRLLFPEAFGMMALVTVVLVGLVMFSDVGLGPSIAQSRRGDDPEFLDTAWTIQVLRGVILWLAACALAAPIAAFYQQPDLGGYIPVAGFSLVIAGFFPTRIETAGRHLLIGRLTALDLVSQVIGIGVTVLLAWATKSVGALVAGMLIQPAVKLVLTTIALPGQKNRFRWEGSAAVEILHFGKWIFLSTLMGFAVTQGDRAILGRFLSLELLGLYNIGFFLGSFAWMLANTVNDKVMIPVYRDKPADNDARYVTKQRLLRAGLTASFVPMLLVMAMIGPWLVRLMYDDRYLMSGPVVTLVACMLIPQVIVRTYDYASLTAGDSRGYFLMYLARATAQIGAILAGVQYYGLVGAIVAMGIATILSYPATVWLAVKHGVWDPLHDAVAAVLSAVLILLVLRHHADTIAALSGI